MLCSRILRNIVAYLEYVSLSNRQLAFSDDDFDVVGGRRLLKNSFVVFCHDFGSSLTTALLIIDKNHLKRYYNEYKKIVCVL